jgi:putative transposase
MARKLRFESAGGMYHVLNRGNYRQWVFSEEGAKVSFEKTLFEACERSGWILHAYVLMDNHFHLALETPEPNLSEGMRWLQSVFATRFNRFRKENGHIFQGRFKSVVVEDFDRLGWLCHYIHLNPVRAGICDVQGLRRAPFGSYALLWNKRKRPSFLEFEACLESAGSLKDSAYGRRKYEEYLLWLVEDKPRQKAMLFESMSKGWAMGTKEFKQALLEDEKSMKACLELGVSGAKEMREMAWSDKLERCLGALGKEGDRSSEDRKSADWKIAIAGYMKTRLLCRNGWLADRLAMGTEFAVSRYVSEMQKGQRKEAEKQFEELIAKVQD